MPSAGSVRMPEILAPVGDRAMAEAAIAARADAIYLGVPGFNARGRSPTLSFEEMGDIVRACRRAGIKAYLAFNTLIFENEWDRVLALIPQILDIAPDAIIVQDPGLALLLHRICPDLRLHASTQMTICDEDSIQFYDSLGFARIVAARELSFPRLEGMIRAAHSMGREIECFAKGALCISYSGQCLTSESFGGGSANRGRCAQSCRFLYDVIADGMCISRSRYAVSARDLDAGEWTERLAQAGADAIKIEGRLKSPDYVFSSVTRMRDLMLGHPAPREGDLDFSRRAYPAWMAGINHQELVDPDVQTHVGEFLGTVLRVDAARSQVIVAGARSAPLSFPLSPGDGVVILSVSLPDGRAGGSIYGVEAQPANALRSASRKAHEPCTVLTFARAFDITAIPAGARVFRNRSIQYERQTKAAMATAVRSRAVPLALHIFARPGQPLLVEYEDPQHRVGRARSTVPCQAASKAPLEAHRLEAEFGALAGTPYFVDSFYFDCPEPVFLHQREWKECRRLAITALHQLRIERTLPFAEPRSSLQGLRSLLQTKGPSRTLESAPHQTEPRDSSAPAPDPQPVLHVLLRSPEQALGLSEASNPESIAYLDFQYGRQSRSTMEILRSKGFRVGLCTLRVPDDGKDLAAIERSRPDAVLIRHAGALHRLASSGVQLVGDFSLNLSNSISADWFLARGLSRFIPATDLNATQITDMLEESDAGRAEMILHQHVPSFYMEYCLYARHLSAGTDFRTCGLPCLKHTLRLRDPEGEEHPVYTDAACRNTMFRGRPQSMAALVEDLTSHGVRHFRLDLLEEDATATERIWEDYTTLLRHPSGRKGMALIRSRKWSEGQLRRKDKRGSAADSDQAGAST